MDVLLFITGAALILGAGALGIPILAGLRARRRFELHVDRWHTRMSAAEQRMGAIETRAEAYPRDLPMPFSPARTDLDTALGAARAIAAEAHSQRRALLHGAGEPPAGTRIPSLLPLILLFDEPRRWRRLDADTADVDAALAGVEASVEEAASALARLEGLPAHTAAACTALEKRTRQTVLLADELAGRGIHGTAFDLTSSIARDLVARLAEARTTTPRDTVAAFELCELLAVPVAEVQAQMEAWAGDARSLDQALADARHALGDAHRRIGALPAGVDGAELARRAEVTRDTLDALERDATRPDVRTLASLAVRARNVVDDAGILADDVDDTAHRQIEFAAHYRRARNTLARAEIEMQAAAAEPIYPLDWREWTGRWAAAQRTLALIGEPATPRTAQTLEVDGALAARVAGQAARVMEAVGQARTQREALRRLLQQPALAPERAWEARAAALHRAALAYAPENWAATDRVPHLLTDAAELAALHARWVPQEAWTYLEVDTLDRRLDAVARLAEALNAFEPALARIEEALSALRTAEAETREALALCGTGLDQLVDSVRSARPAFERPATRHLGTLRQLARHAEVLEASFARRERGTVAGKVRRAERWARAAHARLKPVCRALDAASDEARAALAAELKTLYGGLRLDAEPAVRNATARLAAPAPARQKVRGDRLARAAASIDYARALVADRMATTEANHALSTVTRALSQSLAAWQSARDDADAAWKRLEACRQALTTSWPPLACDAGRPGHLRDTARRALDEVRREEERHLAAVQRVTDAAARLDSLSGAYARAAAAAAEAEVAARQAHARIQAVADALETVLARSSRPEVSREIDHLRRQWAHRPPGEEEAIRELERLQHKLSQP